jgi:integrase
MHLMQSLRSGSEQVSQVKIKGLFRATSKGRVYWYAWRGGPRIYSEPGTDAFLQELSDIKAAHQAPDASKVSGLVAQYRASDEFIDLAASTRGLWSPWLDRIRDHFGTLGLRHFDRPVIRVEIRRWHRSRKATPRAADVGLQVLSRLLSFGVAEGKLAANACKGVPYLHKSNRADTIWTDDQLTTLVASASVEVGQAARLAALTGLRKADLLKLSWVHIGPHAIEMKTGKSRGRKTASVPVTSELRELLAAIPKRATTVLTSSNRRPWTADGFGSSWWKAREVAGLKDTGLRFHDLRGTAATKLYRAGFSLREIAEVLAWSEERVERLIDRYVKRDEILKDRIRRLESHEEQVAPQGSLKR